MKPPKTLRQRLETRNQIAWAIAFIIKSGLTISLGLVATLWHGFVLSKMWAWFIAPWLAIEPISFVQGAGIYLVTKYLTKRHHYTDKDKIEPEDRAGAIAKAFVDGLVIGALSLLTAWILHSLFPL